MNEWPAIAIVPERAEPTLGSIRKSTLPFPLPPDPEVNEIHDAVLLAVHAHPLCAETTMEPVPPNAEKDAPDGLMSQLHGSGAGADWFTVKVRPAIVIVPVRVPPVLFAAAEKPTDPLPVPVAPDVTVSHALLLTAVHVQVAVAVTFTWPDPPPAPVFVLVGLIAYVQFGGVGGAGGAGAVARPCWTIGWVRSPMVTVPERGSLPLDPTRYVTVPLPAPSAPAVTVIQLAVLRAAHLQASWAATVKLDVPVSALSVRRSGSIANWHGAASCITRTWLSLMTMSPWRIVGTVFSSATNATLPSPWPEAGSTFEIQFACVETVHAHSGWAVTAMTPVPPLATMFGGGARVSWHLAGVGPVVTADVVDD